MSRPVSEPLLPTWEALGERPEIVATMCRHLEQIDCVLRLGSVTNAGQALRAFAGFLAETSPEVTGIGQVDALYATADPLRAL